MYEKVKVALRLESHRKMAGNMALQKHDSTRCACLATGKRQRGDKKAWVMAENRLLLYDSRTF